MDLTPILGPLNDAQRAAVTAPVGPVLVLAGAGSGKTRVLTHRIAWVIQAEGASPQAFSPSPSPTRRPARCAARVERLLGVPAAALWIGTFHGIAHRLLRMHWREAQLPQGFQILDSEDQQRLIKKVIRVAGARRDPLGAARGAVVHQLQQGRGAAAGAARRRQRPDAPRADPPVRELRRRLHAHRRGGLRGAAAARLRAVARQPAAARPLPAALPPCAGR